MRAIWVDEGNGPNWDLLAKHDITWIFISLNDPACRKHLDAIKARGLVAGVYSAWNWYPSLDGASFALEVHNRLKQVVPDATPLFPRVQLNDETHSPNRIISMLQNWRHVRPRTATSWTLEGHQGGWFTPALVKTIVETKTRVVPQCYTGPMVPTDPLAAVRDITRRGVPDSMVTPFYDAATSGTPYQAGWFFTMGRLKP